MTIHKGKRRQDLKLLPGQKGYRPSGKNPGFVEKREKILRGRKRVETLLGSVHEAIFRRSSSGEGGSRQSENWRVLGGEEARPSS